MENEVRATAMAWLDETIATHGDVLDQALLKRGFECRGERVQLWVQQGIHKPKLLDAALSLRTSLQSKYSDFFVDETTLIYRYRGTDPAAWDNRAARLAFENKLPLIYLHAVAKARYAVVHPVFIVADDPTSLAFRLKADLAERPGASETDTEALSVAEDRPEYDMRVIRRDYGTRLVLTRLHQRAFRERVLEAYRQQCSMCRLRHPRLLDAAHIVSDTHPVGEPVVSNGLSLCRIHHAAFDLHYLGVEPDTCRVRVRRDLLDEEDGPMLKHGLQALEGVRIQVPHRVGDRPDPQLLAVHWREFCDAG